MNKRAVIYVRAHEAERCDDSAPAKQFRAGTEHCLKRRYTIMGSFCDTSSDPVSQVAVLNELRDFVRLRSVDVIVVRSAIELPRPHSTLVKGGKWSMFGLPVEFAWRSRRPGAQKESP
jgi:hypothetical protein